MNPKRIAVHQGDITKIHVDAIVNAANKSLVEGRRDRRSQDNAWFQSPCLLCFPCSRPHL